MLIVSTLYQRRQVNVTNRSSATEREIAKE